MEPSGSDIDPRSKLFTQIVYRHYTDTRDVVTKRLQFLLFIEVSQFNFIISMKDVVID